MNKKMVLITIIIILIVIISIPFLIGVYNSHAKNQRESIRYCNVDEDCAVKRYVLDPCGGWSTCFNKNEEPLNDVSFGFAFCDYPATSCKCENGECLSCFGEECF